MGRKRARRTYSVVVLRSLFSVVVLRRPTLRRKLKDKRRRIFTRRLEEERGCLLEEVIGKYRWDLGISKVHLLLDGENTGGRVSFAAEHQRSSSPVRLRRLASE